MNNFICTDKETIPMDKCIEKCRLNNRCSSMTFLRALTEERPKDQFSVTKGLNGTRENYLKSIHTIDIDPDQETFKVIGSRAHAKLENNDTMSEVTLRYTLPGGGEIVGTFDKFEKSTKTLEDFKTWGSYKVCKFTGLTAEKEKITNGTYKNGNTKFKTITSFHFGASDTFNEEMQLNMYRIMLKSSHNLDTEHLKIEVFVRDGNTYIAKNRGITKNKFYLNVKFVEDDKVISYYDKKETKYRHALKTNEMPPMCSEYENWGGRKCTGFCLVSGHCENNPFLEDL